MAACVCVWEREREKGGGGGEREGEIYLFVFLIKPACSLLLTVCTLALWGYVPSEKCFSTVTWTSHHSTKFYHSKYAAKSSMKLNSYSSFHTQKLFHLGEDLTGHPSYKHCWHVFMHKNIWFTTNCLVSQCLVFYALTSWRLNGPPLPQTTCPVAQNESCSLLLWLSSV